MDTRLREWLETAFAVWCFALCGSYIVLGWPPPEIVLGLGAMSWLMAVLMLTGWWEDS